MHPMQCGAPPPAEALTPAMQRCRLPFCKRHAGLRESCGGAGGPVMQETCGSNYESRKVPNSYLAAVCSLQPPPALTAELGQTHLLPA